MPGSPREMITTVERTFPVRIRIAIPPGGLGRRHAQFEELFTALPRAYLPDLGTKVSMFSRARALLTFVACALATPVAAQAPAPTTAFDGIYVGTATITRDQGVCIAIPRVDMTIAGGQVIIHEFLL